MPEMFGARSSVRDDWSPLVDPPGEIPSAGREREVFASADGTLACGFWEREPDTWPFERPYDEVAYVLEGTADVELPGGEVLAVEPGSILVTPRGSKGTWRIHETLVKFYAIYSGGEAGDAAARVIREGDPVEWVRLEAAPGDPNPPGEEWYAFRNADGRFSTGVWRRVPETGPMEMGYTEVALVIEGEVDVELPRGEVLSVGPGDVLVSPEGSRATWRARSPVRKFWVVHRGR
jgi:hypothetical protein